MTDTPYRIEERTAPTRVIRPSILYFGTPVAVLGTVDARGRVNLTPISSAWRSAITSCWGLAESSQGCANLLDTGEAVINLPGPAQCAAPNGLATTTGRDPVPAYKAAMGYRHEADKFALAGWTALPSIDARPPRAAECPVQLEARLLAAHAESDVAGAANLHRMRILEMRVRRVHAHQDIVIPGTQHVGTARWSPLLYVFRHYFGTGPRLGRKFRAET